MIDISVDGIDMDVWGILCRGDQTDLIFFSLLEVLDMCQRPKAMKYEMDLSLAHSSRPCMQVKSYEMSYPFWKKKS